MKRKYVVFLLFAIVTGSLLLTGCGGGDSAETAKAATEQKVIKWVMQDTFSSGIPLKYAGEILAKTMNDICQTPEYRLEVEYHYGNELIPVMETVDATSSGGLDACVGWMGYWKGKDSAFPLFASFPLGHTPEDFAIWMYYGDGQECADEVFGKYNMKAFFAGAGGCEGGMWSNFKIDKPEDFDGLKIRTPGFSEDVISAMGASTVGLAGGEIYLAMDRGVIDAAEFSFPCADAQMGFCEVADYWIAPAWWQPSMIEMLAINMDSWNELPPELQKLVEYACKATAFVSYAKWEYENINAIKEIKAAGTQISKLDEASIKKLEALSCELAEDEAAKNPLFKMVAKSQFEMQKAYDTWRWMEKPFGQGMVRETWPEWVEDADYPAPEAGTPEYYAITTE
jgi:TRAP-type mannitol/chloroaromatic compound transport system substrate-binding protein